jgi:hypothetical protein
MFPEFIEKLAQEVTEKKIRRVGPYSPYQLVAGVSGAKSGSTKRVLNIDMWTSIK